MQDAVGCSAVDQAAESGRSDPRVQLHSQWSHRQCVGVIHFAALRH